MWETPAYAVDLLVPYIPSYVKCIWEPACGSGRLVKRLRHHGYDVVGTDLRLDPPSDFLTTYTVSGVNAIITNPPYSLKREFFEHCMRWEVPFALLVPSDLSVWILEAIGVEGCRLLAPTRRIDYITPTGKQGRSSAAQFHSAWLTYDFALPEVLTVAELTLEQKRNVE